MLKNIKKKVIKQVVKELNEKGAFIDSIAVVKEKVEKIVAFKVKPIMVRVVMQDLGMKYRKLNKIPMQGNSERSLVLR